MIEFCHARPLRLNVKMFRNWIYNLSCDEENISLHFLIVFGFLKDNYCNVQQVGKWREDMIIKCDYEIT